MFHLFTHAFFKALLVPRLRLGDPRHGHEQDMRKMGGLRKKMPITFWTMLIGALAMAGIIPFAGFWAKDEILGVTFVKGYYVVWGVGLLIVLLTGIYVFRLIFLTFFGENRADAEVQAHIHESPPVMTVPLVDPRLPGAALLGLVVGVPPRAAGSRVRRVRLLRRRARGIHLDRRGRRAHGSLAAGRDRRHRRRPGGCTSADRRARPHGRARAVGLQGEPQQVYVDEVYAVVPVGATLSFADWYWQFFDVKVIDGTVNGVAKLWGWIGDGLRPIQTGRVQNYAMYVFGGMIVLVVVLAWVWGS